MWVGLLNLENLYGTENSVASVFKRATQQNEPLTVYCKLLKVYESSDKTHVRVHGISRTDSILVASGTALPNYDQEV